jgi:hypothetical protein
MTPTDAELDDLYERSKLDSEIIVGSEVRQLIAEIKQRRRSTTEAELQLWFDTRTAADQMALAKWCAAHPVTNSMLIPEHADIVIWLLDQLAGVNHYEKTDAGVIDWKLEAERANRLLAAAQGGGNCGDKGALLRALMKIAHYSPASTVQPVAIARESLIKAIGTWRQDALSEIGIDPASPEPSTDHEIAARLDRVDAALAKRVGDMIEKNSALKVWLADWLKAYTTDIFPEPDLEQAAAILKANGMTIDSLSASMGRHVLAKVIAQLDGQTS